MREKCDSAYHPSCTAKMGDPNADNMAVVDPQTKVCFFTLYSFLLKLLLLLSTFSQNFIKENISFKYCCVQVFSKHCCV